MHILDLIVLAIQICNLCVWYVNVECGCLCVVEIRRQPQVLAFIVHLWDRLLFPMGNSGLAGSKDWGDSPISTSHLTIGVLGYRGVLLHWSFMCVLGSQTPPSYSQGKCFTQRTISTPSSISRLLATWSLCY